MQVCLLKSKIHRASITDGNLKYEGSLTIAADLMEKCGLIPYERILCSNMVDPCRQFALRSALPHTGKTHNLAQIE